MIPRSEAAPAPAAPPLAWRSWVLGSSAFVLTAAAYLWIGRATPRQEGLEIVVFVLLYTSLACTFLPLPTAWIVLWAAREVGPFPVAIAATVGTCIANVHDYYIVNGLCRLGRVRRARETRLYVRAATWFRRSPFLALAVASFVPIPIDGVRLLAISVRYPRRAYVLASFAGRFPRYVLLALLGHELRLSNAAIGVVLLGVVVLGLGKGALGMWARVRSRAEGERRRRDVARAPTALLLVALAVVGAGVAVRAAPTRSVAEVLAAHCRAREAVSTLRTRFVQTKEFTAIGDAETSSGVFYYRKPDAFRWEYAEPDGSFTVVNGRQGWAVFPSIRQARKIELQDARVEGILSIVGIGPCGPAFGESFDVETKGRRGDAVVLSMKPLRPEIAALFTGIELTLDPRDHLPRTIVLDESTGDRVRFEFLDLRRDVRIEPLLFRFAPPEDYEVIN